MLVPSTVTIVVLPPSAGGAVAHQSPARASSVSAAAPPCRRSDGTRSCVARLEPAGAWLIEVIGARDRYWVATTVSCVAAATVACGEVVAQVTEPAVLEHEYQVPAAAS